jgi:hypothetical protein
MGFLEYWRRPKEDHEGRDARVEAEAALEQAKAQRHSVDVVSDSLKHHTGQNHFADSIAALVRGG